MSAAAPTWTAAFARTMVASSSGMAGNRLRSRPSVSVATSARMSGWRRTSMPEPMNSVEMSSRATARTIRIGPPEDVKGFQDAGKPIAGQTRAVNENHKMCGSDEWRTLVRETILPGALADVDLGDDVLEVGPGYGATTDVLGGRVPRLTAVEIDEELAAMLTDRFAANPAVTIV